MTSRLAEAVPYCPPDWALALKNIPQMVIPGIEDIGSEGNVLLYRMCGAHMYILPKQSLFSDKVNITMQKVAKSIREETHEECYVIPNGGSNHVGMFGSISIFSEIEPMISDITDIVVACGSGGTVSGLGIANYLAGSKVKIHAVIISGLSSEYLHHLLKEKLCYIGLNDIKPEDIVDVIEGYNGRGYSLSTDEELEFIMNVGAETGIMLDPVYTGKAARGLVMELNSNPGRFKGNKVLFIHTGGIFHLFDGRMNQPLINRNASNNSRITIWADEDDDRVIE